MPRGGKRPGAGRKPPPGGARTQQVLVRLTGEMHARVTKIAAVRKCTLQDVVRNALRSEWERYRDA